MNVATTPSSTCPHCHNPVEATSRFCRSCGKALHSPQTLAHDPAADDIEIVLPAPRRIQVEGERISLRALRQMVTDGVEWWQMRLKSGEATREEAASSIEELSKALSSVSHQLAQGRETIRITTTLTPQRRFPLGCPRCGKGNRVNARFCISCGLPLSNTDKASSQPLNSLLHYSIGMVSDVGAKRSINQDSAIVEHLKLSDNTPIICCVVADGMGGAKGGEKASAIACQTIIAHLTTFTQTVDKRFSDWHDVIKAAIAAANTAVFREAEAHPELRGMGTTVVMALVVGERAWVGSVGDSRVYLLNKKGITEDKKTIAQITVDHTMVARLVDIGELTLDQARTHPRRHVLYRSVGVEALVESDVTEQPLQHGDWLLLCSDGVTNELGEQEMSEIVFNASTPQAACGQLINLANKRGARDNVTVLLLKAE